MRVRVIGRHPHLGFSWNGREVYPGDELDVTEPYARMLQQRGWVVPVEPVAVAEAAPALIAEHRDPAPLNKRTTNKRRA